MNFASWLLNPWMLGLGAIAVAVPIIIHLLNKRRFKIVDWAAMDFLLDADKKNRRRVRLENLILLLLRCLAMLLIGLILARPFLPSHLAKVLAENQQYEWVVWLDDSLSHQVQVDQATLFDGAKESLKSLLQRGVQSGSEETLTLFLTSQADKPVISNKPIRADSIAELTRAIDELRCSDWSADYPVALEDLQRYLSGQREDVNRVAYIFSDLRIRDWTSAQTEKAPNETLKKIAELPAMAGCFVVDSGSDWWDNVAISQVQAEDMQVANTVIRFAATVANHGPAIARDVAVRFQVGDEAPQINRIAELAPGQVTIVTFPHMFNAALAEGDDPDAAEPLANVSYHKIRVELAPEANRRDALSSDNGFDYVAPTWRGIPVLFVDGEPNVVPERSEVYFLSATEVKGTGLLADAVTHTEFESISLSKYKVIFLCNVSEVSRDRLVALEQWVRNGGGLVLWPGAQVRATPFNEAFFRDGQGLSPFGLVAEQGDSQRLNYVGFELASGGHSALRVSLSLPNIFNSLKIYKWWGTALAEGDLGKDVAVPLRLTDENRSIAMAERSVGRGRVVGFTFPADLDWTDWPPHPSYAPVIFDLIQYLAARDIRTESVRVGGSFTHLVDLSAFDANVAFVDPAGEMTESLAKPITSSDEATQSVLYQARLDQLRNRGFYQLKLTRGDGRFQPVLFAANIDPGESQLRRLDFQEVGESYFGDRVKRLTLAELDALEISGGRNEIWLQVLAALAAVLLIEQLLGWWFGRRRSGS
jgi:hypothetical protein